MNATRQEGCEGAVSLSPCEAPKHEPTLRPRLRPPQQHLADRHPTFFPGFPPDCLFAEVHETSRSMNERAGGGHACSTVSAWSIKPAMQVKTFRRLCRGGCTRTAWSPCTNSIQQTPGDRRRGRRESGRHLGRQHQHDCNRVHPRI